MPARRLGSGRGRAARLAAPPGRRVEHDPRPRRPSQGRPAGPVPQGTAQRLDARRPAPWELAGWPSKTWCGRLPRHPPPPMPAPGLTRRTAGGSMAPAPAATFPLATRNDRILSNWVTNGICTDQTISGGSTIQSITNFFGLGLNFGQLSPTTLTRPDPLPPMDSKQPAAGGPTARRAGRATSGPLRRPRPSHRMDACHRARLMHRAA